MDYKKEISSSINATFERLSEMSVHNVAGNNGKINQS